MLSYSTMGISTHISAIVHHHRLAGWYKTNSHKMLWNFSLMSHLDGPNSNTELVKTSGARQQEQRRYPQHIHPMSNMKSAVRLGGRSVLSHPILRSKLNAHSMCAQEQDFTHTIENVNTENQCLYYIIFIT
jgi:hypothetical protein